MLIVIACDRASRAIAFVLLMASRRCECNQLEAARPSGRNVLLACRGDTGERAQHVQASVSEKLAIA